MGTVLTLLNLQVEPIFLNKTFFPVSSILSGLLFVYIIVVYNSQAVEENEGLHQM